MNWNIPILPKLTPEHWAAFRANAIGQLFLLLLGALLLDGGAVGMLVFIATFAYWLACLLIIARRYQRLRISDLRFFQFGFAGAVLLAAILRDLIVPFVDRFR